MADKILSCMCVSRNASEHAEPPHLNAGGSRFYVYPAGDAGGFPVPCFERR